ncbi:class F sortase [Actinocatenispora thailandica]|uniref:class F sortase n=1 Tax=Actinocatenispora thailandica TaxID=227318 RepID=UPI001EF16D18|nr:class F sortase [Actinocatenispora thailandica]
MRAGELPKARHQVAPTRIDIGAIGVRARVVATGVDSHGDFSVPPSVDTVGWYRYGPDLTASTGSIVIGGHVDSATEGVGAFFHLTNLRPGNRIRLSTATTTRWFRVVARERIPKATIDLGRYFSPVGAPRLTLFTCGGSFDRAHRSYADNIVVTAVPAR